jgi:hypothetical protein
VIGARRPPIQVALTITGELPCMAVESIRGVVHAAIEKASQATGVDFGFLLRTAHRESGYNPAAQARTSSAAGLFQFVEQTWLSTLKRHGSKYGYARYADLIQQGADGRYRVAGGEARKAVMDLRLDARAASLMAGELASDHAGYLRGRVGRAPTNGELYAAHFLGPQGSARLIQAYQANPGASAAAMFPDAAAANRTIFYRNGRAATVGEVYANLTRTGGSAPVQPAPEQDNGFLRYASARRTERMEQQQALTDFILRGVDLPGGGSREGRSVTGALFNAEMLKVLSEARLRDDRDAT